MVFQPQVVEEVGAGVNHGAGVGCVGAGQLGTRVSGSRFEDSVPGTVVGTGEDAGAADEAADQVADDGAVKVGQHHDVELPRVGNQLHATSEKMKEQDVYLLILMKNGASSIEIGKGNKHKLRTEK